MNTTKVYKLLARHNKKLYSYLKSYTEIRVEKNSIPCLRYSRTNYTYPKFGKLFAFSSLENALRYISEPELESGNVVIAEAEAVGVSCGDYKSIPTHITPVGIVMDFWNNEYVFDIRNRVWPVIGTTPIGTVLCDVIKLVRVLKSSELEY